MNKLYWEPATMLSPLPPVMVSCGNMEKSNIITIAWTGIINSDPAMTYVSIRPERYSYDMVKESGEFVINLTTKDLVSACDWCGVKSGRNFDKFKETGLTPVKGKRVDAPIIEESPINIECKVKDIVHLGSHDMFVAEIVGINVDSSIVDENNKLCLDKAGLVSYAHGTYYSLGRSLGTFGFSTKKGMKSIK